jgi:hypothetical protein
MSSGKAGSAEYPAAGFLPDESGIFPGRFFLHCGGSGNTPAAVHSISVPFIRCDEAVGMDIKRAVVCRIGTTFIGWDNYLLSSYVVG